MRERVQRMCVAALLAAGTVSCQNVDVHVRSPANRYTVPTDEQIAQTRAEFLALPRPLKYKSTITYNFVSGDWATLSLKGTTKAFADAHAIPELTYALWQYMDGAPHDAEALIVLMGKLGGGTFVGEALTYRDATNVGNWTKFGDTWIHSCKVDAKDALGKLHLDGWYPHKVLFAPTVWAESVDPVKRAAHIEAMRAALRDPALRVDNPAAVHDIIDLLYRLDAKEAAPEVASHLFFSWKQGGAYRASTERLRLWVRAESLADKVVVNIGSECPAHEFLASEVGRSSVPLFLEKYSDTSAEDRSVSDGGGCAPLFALQYFVFLKRTRVEAVADIDAYLLATPGLTPERTAVLVSLRQIVQSGQYQTQRLLFDNVPGGWDPVTAP